MEPYWDKIMLCVILIWWGKMVRTLTTVILLLLTVEYFLLKSQAPIPPQLVVAIMFTLEPYGSDIFNSRLDSSNLLERRGQK